MNTLSTRSTHSDKERAFLARLRQLLIDPCLLHATLIRDRRKCGKPYCYCAKDKDARHVSWCIVQTRDRKTHKRNIPPNLYREVRRWMSRYGEVRRLLNKLSDCSWGRIKEMSKK